MQKLLINRWFHFFLLFTLLMFAVYHTASRSEWRLKLQFAVFDSLNKMHPRPKPENAPVYIVDIDEESLVKLGQWPWPRNLLGRLVLNLDKLGAKVTAFDMVFAEPDRTAPSRIAERLPDNDEFSSIRHTISMLPDHDELFGQAIAGAGNVVTAFTAATPEDTLRTPAVIRPVQASPEITQAFLQSAVQLKGAATNLPVLSQNAAGNGSFIATPEIDGIIRNISLLFSGRPRFGDILLPSLNLEALRIAEYGKTGQIMIAENESKAAFEPFYQIRLGKMVGPVFIGQKYKIPLDADGKFWVYYRHIDRSEYIPAYKVIDDNYHDEIADKIKGKIIFVGASPEGLKDIRSTPLTLFAPGVEVHVNVAEQVLQSEFLVRPELVIGIEALIIFLFGLLVILLSPFAGVVTIAFICACAVAAGFAVTWYAYQDLGLLLDPVYPSLSIALLFSASSILTYVRTEADRKHIREAFGLYISPDFMEELTRNPDKLKLGGETRELTVMFTDIRSFTSISETMTPEALTQLMNDFLTPMSDLVMSNRGTIDKYMGDAMMAFWNAPLDDEDHARHACMAALQMNKALDPINAALRQKAGEVGQKPLFLEAGIGINTGMASVGNMGSKQRFAYSALGDTVNLASRLEGQTKQYGVRILLGERTRMLAPEFAALELDLIKVKGKKEPERIFVLLGDEEMARGEYFQNWKVVHDRMLERYRAMKWDDARKLADQCATIAREGMQIYYNTFMARFAEMKKNPPPPDWDGVFVATSK